MNELVAADFWPPAVDLNTYGGRKDKTHPENLPLRCLNTAR